MRPEESLPKDRPSEKDVSSEEPYELKLTYGSVGRVGREPGLYPEGNGTKRPHRP
mgnify:FL=1